MQPDLFGPELVLILGISVLACYLASGRLRTPAPILLLCAGVLLGFAPALRAVQLPPEAVLFLFLPALLYWEALTTSLRMIRRNLRGIVLMSTALVVLTAAAVAVVGHALGLPWGAAWVLGAAIAPTDATAVASMARALPHRDVTLLRAESLINDGTALVVYGVAVTITVGGGGLSGLEISGLFLLAYTGGAAAGLVSAWFGVFLRRYVQDPVLGNVVTVLTPFTAFVLGELVHASGVLAVVVCGLAMSQLASRVMRAETRQRSEAFWSLSTFMLNGSLFVLVGLELQNTIRHLRNAEELTRGLLAIALVAVVLVAVRLAFIFVSTYLIRLVDRRPSQRLRRVSDRSRVVNGLAGFRGAVSLAAALATPATVATGAPFPDRNLIIFIAAGVIVATLVVQGPLLPVVARWAHLPEDRHIRDSERRLADITITSDALTSLQQAAGQLGTDQEVVDVLRREYEGRLHEVEGPGQQDPAVRHRQQYRDLHLALLARKRASLLRLRDEHRIDDAVLREIQYQLDLEEVRLNPPAAPE